MTHSKDAYTEHYAHQVEEHVAALIERLNHIGPLTTDETHGYVAACRHWLHGHKGEPEQPAEVQSPQDFHVGVRVGYQVTGQYAIELLRRQMSERADEASDHLTP